VLIRLINRRQDWRCIWLEKTLHLNLTWTVQCKTATLADQLILLLGRWWANFSGSFNEKLELISNKMTTSFSFDKILLCFVETFFTVILANYNDGSHLVGWYLCRDLLFMQDKPKHNVQSQVINIKHLEMMVSSIHSAVCLGLFSWITCLVLISYNFNILNNSEMNTISVEIYHEKQIIGLNF
jgi:hypothetical protein